MKRHEEIQRLAYEFFEKSGGAHGRDLEHWFEAEHMIRARQESMHARDLEAAASKERPHERSDARWHQEKKEARK